MDKQIVHEEEVHGYGQPHAGARAKHYRSAGRVDAAMSTTNAHAIRVYNPYRSREDPALSHEGRLKKWDSEISEMSRNPRSPTYNNGEADLLISCLFRSLPFCSTEPGGSASYPERAAPILVKATRVRTRGCLIPAVWLAVALVSKLDCTSTIPKSIAAQFEAQRSTRVSGHSRSPIS